MEMIAIYWGAFNPPTIWHRDVISKLLIQNKVSKIIFSPDWQRADKDYKITFSQRCEMLEIFFKELKNQWLNVEFDDYFLKRSWNTTTMQVEEYFSKKLWFQAYHIFWIDTINNMPNRLENRHRYIEERLKKIFILRKGFVLPEKIDMENYFMYDLDILEISSTTVREMIRNKWKVDHILTPEIHRYIKENNLYRNEKLCWKNSKEKL